MALTAEERIKVDILKDQIAKKQAIQHAEDIRQIGLEEIESEVLREDLSVEDRAEVDLAKPELQKELDAKAREEELKTIALQELEGS